MNSISFASLSSAYLSEKPNAAGVKELDKRIQDGFEGRLTAPLPAGVTPRMAAERCLIHLEEYPESVGVLMQNAEIRCAAENLEHADDGAKRDRLLRLLDLQPNNASSEDFDGGSTGQKLHENDARGDFSKTQQNTRGAPEKKSHDSRRNAARSFCTHFGESLKSHWKTVVRLAVVDAGAAFAASLIGIAAMMRVPQHRDVGLAMAVAAQAVGGFLFGHKLGYTLAENRSWGRYSALRHVPGTILSLGCAASAAMTAMQYRSLPSSGAKSPDESPDDMAQAVLFTAVYSLTQDIFLAMAGKRLSPHLALPEDRKLHLTLSKDTALHGLRLALGTTAYFLSSLSVGSLAGNSVNASIPPMADGDQAVWGKELTNAVFRSINEACDAFFGALALLAVFGESVEERPRIGWKEGVGRSEFKSVGYEVAAREFMNLTASAFSRAVDNEFGKARVDEVDARKAFLAALTHVRGGLINALPTPPTRFVLAEGCGTRKDGNCLLHAVAGTVDQGEWRLERADKLRRALAREMVARSNAPAVTILARHYLQEVTSFIGGSPVHDGADMLRELPPSVATQLLKAVVDENKAAMAREIGDPAPLTYVADAIEASIGASVEGIAAYYGQDGNHLPTLAVPLLAATLRSPIALHDAAGVRIFNAAGNETQAEPANTVHIRHSLLTREVGHFERIARETATNAQVQPNLLWLHHGGHSDPTENSQLDDMEEQTGDAAGHSVHRSPESFSSRSPFK